MALKKEDDQSRVLRFRKFCQECMKGKEMGGGEMPLT